MVDGISDLRSWGLGAQARDRVRIEFTLARMAQRYGAVWEDVAGAS